MAEFRISYDAEARAIYVEMADEPAASTEELVKDLVWVDRNSAGRVVGFEAISVDADDLPSALHFVERQLRAAAASYDDDDLLALT